MPDRLAHLELGRRRVGRLRAVGFAGTGVRRLAPGDARVALLAFAGVEDVAGPPDAHRRDAGLHDELLAVGLRDRPREGAQGAPDEVEQAALLALGGLAVLLDHELRLRPQGQAGVVHHRHLHHAVRAGDDAVARVDLRAANRLRALATRLHEVHVPDHEGELAALRLGEQRQCRRQGDGDVSGAFRDGSVHVVRSPDQPSSQRIIDVTSWRLKS